MEPFIGMIVQFGGNFAPRGWALCDGQLLAISSNSALFSILGTTYGGDGVSTFGLPDLRGRVAVHAGTGPGLSPRRLGQKSGTETQTLTVNQMPSHNHLIQVNKAVATTGDPVGNVLGHTGAATLIYEGGTPTQTMNPASISNTGASQPVSTVQPFQCVNFIIALQGTYPSRN